MFPDFQSASMATNAYPLYGDEFAMSILWTLRRTCMGPHTFLSAPVSLCLACEALDGGASRLSACAFDLFVGRWIYLDAREREIHHAFVAPPLIVTIFFDPIGFALYGLVRAGQALIRRGDVS